MRQRFILLLLWILPSLAFSINPPNLQSPNNASTLSKFDVFASASSVSGAKGYQFQFDTVPTFSSPYMRTDTNFGPYVYSPELQFGKTYYWRARCYALTDTSVWTSTWTFNVVAGANALNSPGNNTTGPIAYLYSLGAGAGSYIKYIFEADTASNFSTVNKVLRVQPERNFADSLLFGYNRTIYWRARACNSKGDTLSWSPTWKYTTHQVPALNASQSGLTMVDPKIFLNWGNPGLSAVQMQIDTSITYNTSQLQNKLVPPGTLQDSFYNLHFGKYYYVRIRGVYKGKVSPWSFTYFIRVYSTGNIMNPSYGSTIGLGTSTGFSWLSFDGAKYQFQLFSDSAYTNLLKDTLTSNYGYSYKYGLQLNKWYLWRVRYLHEKDTTPWILGSFKTYSGMLNLGAPANNASNLAVRSRFSFRKEAWGTAYVMEIDTGLSIGSVHSSYFIRVVDSFKYDGSYYHYLDTTLAYGKNYVWRVYALKGSDTAEATVRRFTTAGAPANYYPPNNYIGTGPSTGALVTGITGSNHIQWQLDTSSSFGSNQLQMGTDPHVPDDFSPPYIALNFPADLLFHTKYFWRSRCINSIDTSKWSPAFNFITTQEVWVTSPLNGATQIPLVTKLDWGLQGSNFDSRYQYQIGLDSLLTGRPIITLPKDAVSEVSVNLAYGTKYYWRARAFHAKDTSHWSAVFNFKTLDAPVIGVPALLNPANGATKVPLIPVTLSWGNAANATSYDIHVSTSTDFNVLIASGNTPGNSILFSGAQPNTRYYWRVKGVQGTLSGPWSATRWFETAPPTGENELLVREETRVYPNPAEDYFVVKAKGLFQLSVFDINGKKMYSSPETEEEQRVQTDSWERGVYVLVIEQNGARLTKKLLLN